MTPNRIATVIAVIAGVATALAPVVANMDWESTAGIIAGGVAAVTAILTWLVGWQKHEARVETVQAIEGKPIDVPPRTGGV